MMKMNYPLKVWLIALFIAVWSTLTGAQNQFPIDVLKPLNRYNVTWNSLYTRGSMESMPLGNGDIIANVWIE